MQRTKDVLTNRKLVEIYHLDSKAFHKAFTGRIREMRFSFYAIDRGEAGKKKQMAAETSWMVRLKSPDRDTGQGILQAILAAPAPKYPPARPAQMETTEIFQAQLHRNSKNEC